MSSILEKDSNQLIQLLEKNKLLEKDDVGVIQKIHKVSYSLTLWGYIHKDSKNKSKYFLEEIRSDCVQAIPLILMGYKKSTSLLLRGVIENSLKYIYFYDHPIELYHYFNDEKNYIPMEDLYKYVYNHPIYIDRIEKFDFTNILRKMYREYSFVVHGKNMDSLQLYKSITEITFDKSFLLKCHGELKTLGSILNYMFALFYWEEFGTYKKEYKDIIFDNIEPKQKKILRGID